MVPAEVRVAVSLAGASLGRAVSVRQQVGGG
jgi:hypothetical protein